MNDDQEARQHAEMYHRTVHQASLDQPVDGYSVWTWEEMRPANRNLLTEASRRFLRKTQGDKLQRIEEILFEHSNGDDEDRARGFLEIERILNGEA